MDWSRHYLLDASALLALLLNEPGAEQVQLVFDRCAMHALNLAEVVRKMAGKGMPGDEIRETLKGLQLDTLPIEERERQAYVIGLVAAANRKIGLSLGDAVCLTAAAWEGMKAVTAERSWNEICWPDVGENVSRPEVVLIR
jgi:ribonuclease VapC